MLCPPVQNFLIDIVTNWWIIHNIIVILVVTGRLSKLIVALSDIQSLIMVVDNKRSIIQFEPVPDGCISPKDTAVKVDIQLRKALGLNTQLDHIFPVKS